MTLQILAGEARIERSVHLYVAVEFHSRQRQLFGHDKDVVERFGQTEPCVFVLEQNFSAAGSQQSGNQIEQGRLAGAVGPEEPVDAAFSDVEREIVDNRLAAPRIAEAEIFDFKHDVFD